MIRYNYIKSIEHRVSSDIYSMTSRGNVCDVLRSPFDVHLMNYPTNLPKHLETIINGFQKDAERLATGIVTTILSKQRNGISYPILNAVQFLGQAFGYHIGQENQKYKGYLCSDMLTRDEISIAAGTNLCNWLEHNGYEINGTCFTREPCLCVLASKNNEKILVIFSAEIAPTAPGFLKEDLDELYNVAMRYKAIPYYACVNIGSADEKHFNDGVIIANDSIKFMVRAFDVLETED